MARTRDQRFWEKVSHPGCLIWLGARNSWGYGTFSMAPQKNINASRAAWILTKGEIPEGMDVLHTCNNKLCCNVEHMYLGTDKENADDRKKAGSVPRGESAWNATLTEAQVKEILARKTGKRGEAAQFAKEYGVKIGAVGAILRGASWKHLPR